MLIQIGDNVENQARKAVQMHCLTRYLALMFEKQCNSLMEGFGQSFVYNKVFYGKYDAHHVTIEEFIDGTFVKYINNNGVITCDEGEVRNKSEAFIHFTWERSGKNLMVVDLQGVEYCLCDPEVASMDICSKDEEGKETEFFFCLGNLSEEAITTFQRLHVCNDICKALSLSEF